LKDAPAPRRAVQAVQKVGGFEVVEEEKRAGTPSGKVVTGGGFGDSVAAKEPARPAPRGTVTTAGFGATENAPAGKQRSLGTVSAGGFNQQVAMEASRPKPRAKQPETIDTSVEIVSKPKPIYTDEARSLRVEGEVVLEVTFVASGALRVLRVVRSLGHGLDEAAIAAAQKIQFTPARRDGVAVDYTATLRVVFRLA
jgi:TonB family protein